MSYYTNKSLFLFYFNMICLDELDEIRYLCKIVIDLWTRIMTDNLVEFANPEMNELDLKTKL